MPVGYVISLKNGIVGNIGERPESSLMTEAEAKSILPIYVNKEGKIAPTTGRYVGCKDCPYVEKAYETGCLDHGIDSSNCRRTKES